MIDSRQPENLLWNIERIVTNVFIPILNSSSTGEGNEDLKIKVKNELLPCLRSFTRFAYKLKYLLYEQNISSLRVAETVWMEGVFLKEYPPEAYTIKCLEDAQAFIATEGGFQRFEGYLKSWMKKIQVI